MSAISRFNDECEALDMPTCVTANGVMHVLNPINLSPNCSNAFPVDGLPATTVCMDCRELPGRERHARRVYEKEES